MTEASPQLRRVARVPLAWWIAGGTMIGLMMGYSGFMTATIGQFLDPISRSNGWTRAETNGAFGLALAVTVILAPIAGFLVDRWGAPHILLIGVIGFPLAVATLALSQGSLLRFYISMAAVATIGALTLPAAYTSITLRWFDHHRGIGFGIALSGVGLSQVVLPPVIHLVMDGAGWQIAIIVIAALMMAVMLPIAIFMARTPQGAWEMDGGLRPAAGHPLPAAAEGMPLRAALASRHFWQLVVAFILLGPGAYGILANYPSILRESGFTTTEMVRLIALEGATMIAARLGSGWMLDHLPVRTSAAVVLGAPIVGMALVAAGLGGNMVMAVIATALIGIGIGGEMNVMSFFTSRYFHRNAYAKLAGFTYSAFNIGGVVGAPALAACFDHYGSYRIGLTGVALTTVMAVALIVALPRIEAPPERTVP